MSERWIADRYRLVKKILPGDSVRGIPELWQAQDAGDVYFAKIWKRTAPDGNVLQALWNCEIWSRSRLQGYPGAAELFVRLQDLGEGEEHYYAVFDGGRRMLLSDAVQHRSKYHWLLNLGEVGRRRPLWEGLLKVAEALSILHGEGTLHRSLSSTSVFASPELPGDFRLSGFEWSLRIASREGAAAKVGQGYLVRAPELERTEAEYSILTDWFDFGLLAAEIFGVAVHALRKRDLVRSAVQKLGQLRDFERQAILHFIAENPDDRIASAEAAVQYLRNIIRELNVATAGLGRSLVLAVRFSPNLDISKTIEGSSKGKLLQVTHLPNARGWKMTCVAMSE